MGAGGHEEGDEIVVRVVVLDNNEVLRRPRTTAVKPAPHLFIDISVALLG